jgi:6-phosphofructokinase 1
MPLPNGESLDMTSRAVETYNRLGLDCLVCLGGNGTHKVANNLATHGLNVIGLPKTIDNDLAETDITFGHDSAVTTAAQAIDRLYSTAEAHLRVMVIELMGHHAGWLALTAGVGGGADIILIPEIPYDIESICQHLTERRRRGKWFSIVAVSEGARPKPREAPPPPGNDVERDGKKSKKDKDKKGKKDKKNKPAEQPDPALDDAGDGRASSSVAKAISRRLGMETRVTVLGHLQRGGIPTPFDRVLATRFGTFAAEMLSQGTYNRMVCMKGSEVTSVPLELVAGKIKLVPREHALIRAARRVGTNFGD